MAAKWNVEFYEDAQGRRPVEKWLDRLSDQKAEAATIAVNQVLAMNGMALASTAWLKPVGSGLYEFRIRHTKTQIQNMYAAANQVVPSEVTSVLLRIFVAFEGDRVILLLGAYDKGKNDSASFQQEQIGIARKRLKDWKRRQG